MVPMTVADVVRRKTPGEEPEQFFTGHIVVLLDEAGRRALPIWIGQAEAIAIAIGLRQLATDGR